MTDWLNLLYAGVAIAVFFIILEFHDALYYRGRDRAKDDERAGQEWNRVKIKWIAELRSMGTAKRPPSRVTGGV